jgi:fructose-1,6-bisphosphatase/inositol monophosphatase family enzyme
MHKLTAPVEALLRNVARDIVMPRFQKLATHEVEVKSPGEEVTIADREAELRLNEGLAQIYSEARMIGEEACASDPSLLDRMENGSAWVIDPIDGTSNFAAGRPHFAIMLALVCDGVAEAGWMFDPILDRMCHSARGSGAFIDGIKISARESGEPLPVAAISLKFLKPEQRAEMIVQTENKVILATPPMCAAEQYPRVTLGANDIAVFARVLPWDHIAGSLFLTEAGGKVARMDGSPYQFWDGRAGLLAASSPTMWDRAAQLFEVQDFG